MGQCGDSVCVCVCVCFQSGLTSLHLAAQEDRVGVAEVLTRHGANADQQTKVKALRSAHLL